MAGKDFVNSQLAVAGVDLQPFPVVPQEEDGSGWWELQAGLLSTQDIGGLASIGPGCGCYRDAGTQLELVFHCPFHLSFYHSRCDAALSLFARSDYG